jgi:putative transposase
VIRKSNEAWRSFLALKALERAGRLPPHIERVSMPRYWKRNGRRELRIIVRNDSYKIRGKYLRLPKGLRLRWKGNPKWHGKQGRLEIVYDDVDGVWRGFMAVRVEEPPMRGGNKSLYIDLGVRCLATVWHEGMKRSIAFRGGELLWDWWYWTRRIVREQGRLARINKTKSSRSLRKLYRIRQRRFRHAINAMIRLIVGFAQQVGISMIVVGKLKGIRRNNHKNSRTNAMIHNFWSFRWTVQRLKEKAEEYGMKVVEASEFKTSSICPRCGSDRVFRRGRLFKCLKCGLEAHRDAIAALNMVTLHNGGMPIGVVAHPLLLRWDGMRWEGKSPVNNRPVNTSEARISPLKWGECQVASATLLRRSL